MALQNKISCLIAAKKQQKKGKTRQKEGKDITAFKASLVTPTSHHLLIVYWLCTQLVKLVLFYPIICGPNLIIDNQFRVLTLLFLELFSEILRTMTIALSLKDPQIFKEHTVQRCNLDNAWFSCVFQLFLS